MEHVEVHRLSNDLEMRVLHMLDCPFAYIGAVVHAGALHEELGEEGLAHLLEHVMIRSADPAPMEFFRRISESGGYFMPGAVGWERMVMHAMMPLHTHWLDAVLQRFAQQIFGPITRDALAMERPAVLAEWREEIGTSEMQDIFLQRRRALTMPSRAHSSDVLGTPESIRRLTIEQLDAFRQQHHHVGNITIVSAGGASVNMLRERLMETLFGDSTGHSVRSSLPQHRCRQRPVRNEYVIPSQDPDADHGAIQISWAVPHTVHAWLVEIVGDCLTDALYEALRDDMQVAYSIRPSVQSMGAVHMFSCSIPGIPFALMPDVQARVTEIVHGLTAFALRHWERGVVAWRNAILMRDRCVEDQFKAMVRDIELGRDPFTLRKELSLLASFTADDIRRVCREWLTQERMFLMLEGPAK